MGNIFEGVCDFIIFSCYIMIPASLAFFLKKYQTRIPKGVLIILILWVLFVLCCGLTHLFMFFLNDIFSLMAEEYYENIHLTLIVLKFITALVSTITAFVMILISPIILKIGFQVLDKEQYQFKTKFIQLEQAYNQLLLVNEDLSIRLQKLTSCLFMINFFRPMFDDRKELFNLIAKGNGEQPAVNLVDPHNGPGPDKNRTKNNLTNNLNRARSIFIHNNKNKIVKDSTPPGYTRSIYPNNNNNINPVQNHLSPQVNVNLNEDLEQVNVNDKEESNEVNEVNDEFKSLDFPRRRSVPRNFHRSIEKNFFLNESFQLPSLDNRMVSSPQLDNHNPTNYNNDTVIGGVHRTNTIDNNDNNNYLIHQTNPNKNKVYNIITGARLAGSYPFASSLSPSAEPLTSSYLHALGPNPLPVSLAGLHEDDEDNEYNDDYDFNKHSKLLRTVSEGIPQRTSPLLFNESPIMDNDKNNRHLSNLVQLDHSIIINPSNKTILLDNKVNNKIEDLSENNNHLSLHFHQTKSNLLFKHVHELSQCVDSTTPNANSAVNITATAGPPTPPSVSLSLINKLSTTPTTINLSNSPIIYNLSTLHDSNLSTPTFTHHGESSNNINRNNNNAYHNSPLVPYTIHHNPNHLSKPSPISCSLSSLHNESMNPNPNAYTFNTDTHISINKRPPFLDCKKSPPAGSACSDCLDGSDPHPQTQSPALALALAGALKGPDVSLHKKIQQVTSSEGTLNQDNSINNKVEYDLDDKIKNSKETSSIDQNNSNRNNNINKNNNITYHAGLSNKTNNNDNSTSQSKSSFESMLSKLKPSKGTLFDSLSSNDFNVSNLSIDKCLSHPLSIEIIKDIAIRLHSIENILFLLDTKLYKQLFHININNNNNTLLMLGKGLFLDYPLALMNFKGYYHNPIINDNPSPIVHNNDNPPNSNHAHDEFINNNLSSQGSSHGNLHNNSDNIEHILNPCEHNSVLIDKRRLAYGIFSSYIKTGSKLEINISHGLKNKLMMKFLKLSNNKNNKKIHTVNTTTTTPAAAAAAVNTYNSNNNNNNTNNTNTNNSNNNNNNNNNTNNTNNNTNKNNVSNTDTTSPSFDDNILSHDLFNEAVTEVEKLVKINIFSHFRRFELLFIKSLSQTDDVLQHEYLYNKNKDNNDKDNNMIHSIGFNYNPLLLASNIKTVDFAPPSYYPLESESPFSARPPIRQSINNNKSNNNYHSPGNNNNYNNKNNNINIPPFNLNDAASLPNNQQNNK